ncbi:CBS domain-containing protein [Halegenticoccus tardaugens]|uniref:CBS domain-containing protein n=1 Tax=Halegenticoccus tardaugens TaxID=2071624 RepID=UPI0013E94287|nr:CBS domain-containing protein [Halegenticoccus tardaugens]
MRDSVTVRDIMVREFVGVSESDAIGAAAELMLEEGVGSVVVLRGRTPVGAMSARDALAAFVDREAGSDPSETPVAEIMSPPAPTVDASDGLAEAEARLVSEAASRLLVVDDDELVGVVEGRDVMAAGRSRVQDVDEASSTTFADDRADATEEGYAAENGEYTTQSICEVCGTFANGLTNSNGQLVCADCLEI